MMLKRLIQFTFILVAIFFAMDAKAGVIFRPVHHFGLVGYWDFQEGAGNKAYDKSGNSNHLTLNNMDDTAWVDGKIGGALDFERDNSQYLSISDADQTGLDLLGDYTITFWINYEIFDQYGLINKENNGYGYRLYNTWISSGYGPKVIHWNNYSADLVKASWDSGSLSTGTWYFYSLTFDNTANKHQWGKNASFDTADAQNYDVVDNSGAFQIGNTPDGYFDGKLDEVRVYNRALSAGEIQRLYKLSQPTVAAAPRTGLVGYWPFEENTGTKAGDHSGYGNNGDLTNMEASDWVNGKIGKALDFDGSNEYVGKTNPSWDFTANPTNTFSLSAWFKPDACVDLSGVELSLAGAGSLRLFCRTTGAYWGFQIQNGTTYSVSANNTCVIGQWQHLVGVYDAVAVKIYLYYNGNLVDSDTPGTNTSAISDALAIGNAQEYFNGQIDEVRVYNRALETSEIQALYKSGLAKINASQNTKLTNGLVGLWSFNGTDIDGNEAYDRSGQNNHGTITGATRTIGRLGQALNFNGSSDYVYAQDSDSLDIGGDKFTISCWFKANSLPGPSSSVALVYKDDTSYAAYNLRLGNYDGAGVQLLVNARNTSNVLYQRESTITESFSTGIWYHVVGVLPGAGSKLLTYINAVDKSQWDDGAFSGTLKNADWRLNIGTIYEGGGFFNGIIDEVRVYNRALTAQEIQRLYNMGH